MKNLIYNLSVIISSAGFVLNPADAEAQTQVGLYRTFERSIENINPYSNKFDDVELKCTYISPSGDSTEFFGFFDGDGDGGGNITNGNIWKIRFLPDEVGEWNYEWEWSDTTAGGEGTFICDSSNRGKGILRPYKENPHWFAYNGNEPVWIKSYYESSAGAIAQPFEWITANVYQPMLDRGYNHFQVNWLFPLCCYHEYYHDGPAKSVDDLTLYQNGKASGTMRLDVWKMLEQTVTWLNDRNVGLHMFLGFDGSRNGGPEWTSLSSYEKEFYVKYVVARLAPYANIAGWNFVWEVPGDRVSHELGWARIVQKFDVFDHLRTYHDEKPALHEYNRPEYNFAAIENHYMYSPDNRDLDFPHWRRAWSHHAACLAGYVPGKPVIMTEGNALWLRYWGPKCGATQDDLRQAAWGCATAGASFLWCGHVGGGSLTASLYNGLPFYGDVNIYASSAMQIDILSDVMTKEVVFCRMHPSDSLLSDHDTLSVWCLSEPGEQYLVFSINGSPFKLQLSGGEYSSNQWVSTMTGAGNEIPAFTASENEIVSFNPPDSKTDWVLLIRKDAVQNINEEATFISAKTDTTGTRLVVSCDKEIIVPDGYRYSFKITDKGGTKVYYINSIISDTFNRSIIIIDLNTTIPYNKEIVLSYEGTLTATDGAILAPAKEMDVENNSKYGIVSENMNILQKTGCMVYPNPCADQLEISHDGIMKRIQIFNISGVSVFEKKNVTLTNIRISLNDIPAGLYVLSVTAENTTIMKHFIKN